MIYDLRTDIFLLFSTTSVAKVSYATLPTLYREMGFGSIDIRSVSLKLSACATLMISTWE